MPDIQQIYCTHCTHGSSALERHEGDFSHRTLGYSARAGSLPAEPLRACYRQIERYVYYYLPRDTPIDQKVSLTAALAPRRLMYLGSTGGLQIAGQVCYRTTDSEGRVGSYFAHVLFREQREGAPGWSALDCLRLWHAPGWVEEDLPQIPFLLPALNTADALLGGRRGAIDDQVLLSFLLAPAGGNFDDPGQVIPQRWRHKDPALRRGLLVDALDGLLEIAAGQRESLLLVAEPELAALVFYGTMRLLPRGSLAEGVSFSTFEPNPDRLCTTLAATTFHDPAVSDLRPEAYRSDMLAINTFLNRRSDRRRAAGLYAQYVVARLVEQGWPAVDRMLGHMQACGAREASHLEHLATVDRLVPVLLGSQPSPDRQWRDWPLATDYLRRLVCQELSGMGAADARLRSLAGTPAHLLLLELAAHDTTTGGVRQAIEFLLKSVPSAWTAEVVNMPQVPAGDRADVLARYVISRASLPAGCDWLWTEADGALAGQGRLGDTLLAALLARLDPKALERFYQNVAAAHGDTFLLTLMEACRQTPPRWEPLSHVVGAAQEETLIALYQRRGPAVFQDYPSREPAMRARLCGILHALPAQAQGFSSRLDMVLSGQYLLANEPDVQMALAWNRCRKAMLDVGRLWRQRSGVLRRRPLAKLDEACRRMADAAAEAMPAAHLKDDSAGSAEQAALRRLGLALLNGNPLLPANCWQHQALWQKVSWRFSHGAWPTVPLGSMSPEAARAWWPAWLRPGGSPRVWLGLAAGLAVVLLGAWLLLGGRTQLASLWGGNPEAKTVPQKMAPAAKTAGSGRPEQMAAGKPAVRDVPGPGAVPGLKPAPKTEPDLAPAPKAQPRPPEPQPRDDPQEIQRQAAARAQREEQLQREEQARREEQWRDAARRYATEHGGALLDHAPLAEGVAALPAALVSDPAHPPKLYVGAGRIYTEQRSYEFGQTFHKHPPSVVQEVPELAAELGLESVLVALDVRSGGTAVVLQALPKDRPAAEDADERQERKRLEERRNLISALVRRKIATRSDEKLWQDEMLKLLAITLPDFPDRPNPEDPKFKDNLVAFENARRAYQAEHDRVVRERDDMLANLKLRAVEEIKNVTAGIEELKVQGKAHQSQWKEQTDRALLQLRQRCKQISLVLYQAVEGPPPESTAAELAPPATPSAQVIAGKFTLAGPAAFQPVDAYTARVSPRVLDPFGLPIAPAAPNEKFTVHCELRERQASGPDRKQMARGTRGFDPVLISDGTVDVLVRFQFCRNVGPLPGVQAPVIAESPWCQVGPLRRGEEYTLSFHLSDEEMTRLRQWTGGSGPRGF